MNTNLSAKPYISVVSPVYACEHCLQTLHKRLVKSLGQITQNFEIILVNDQSPDGAWEEILKLAQEDKRVKGIDLSRNFGQHPAISAGLNYARGEWVVVMDCDLQDQPEEILKLHSKAMEGFDIVFGRRELRKDSFLKKFGARLFRKVYGYLTDQKIDPATANLSIISEKVLASFSQVRDQNRSYPTIVRWLGFRSTSVNIDHAARTIGKSAYSLRRLFYLAYDVIVAHSNKPLRLSIVFGFIMSLASILYGAILVIKYLFMGVPIAGWTSVMVSIYLVGGLLFANLGILGLYIGKTFNEIKGRPHYLVRNSVNLESPVINTSLPQD
jgi:glycosyltransferase involved in cell wall biosynthesis